MLVPFMSDGNRALRLLLMEQDWSEKLKMWFNTGEMRVLSVVKEEKEYGFEEMLYGKMWVKIWKKYKKMVEDEKREYLEMLKRLNMNEGVVNV